MQAITVALSPAGLQYYATQKLQADLAQILSGIAPPNASFNVGNVNGGINTTYLDVNVSLNQGQSSYSPTLQSFSQGTGGQFVADMSGSNFAVSYIWNETYTTQTCTDIPNDAMSCSQDGGDSNNFNFNTSASLDVTVTFQVTFNSSSSTWSLPVLNTKTSPNVTPNVPNGSVVQQIGGSCAANYVPEVVDQAMQNINFASAVSGVMPAAIATISASGQLTPNIVFGFAVGDSGITFPNDQGMALGVTGLVSWKGTPYPGTAPSGLAVPPVPTDGHHLQMYVSDYTLNGLYWAFYNDGQLATTVTPDELPDPGVLKVKTYVSTVPALKPYEAKVMYAQIVPLAAPTITFQTVYIFTTAVMTQLQGKLPTNVYNAMTGMAGNAYASQASLEADLTTSGVPQQYFSAIEQIAQLMGGATTHDLQFTLTIQDEPDPAPYIEFSVQRTDAMSAFVLAAAGQVQSLQFGFNECFSTAKFVNSNIPHFDGSQFPSLWGIVGDDKYDEVLQASGKKGVPLPIMQDFQFLFEQAVLNVEKNFVSILANVQFTS